MSGNLIIVQPNLSYEWGRCPESRHSDTTRFLKITGKVSCNIASEASSVYIFCGQSWLEIPKMVRLGDFFEKLKIAVKQCYEPYPLY